MKKTIGAVGAAFSLLGVGLSAPVTAASSVPAQGATPTADASSSYTPPPVTWGTCANARLSMAGAQCGFVEVPLDYAKPKGEKIKIAVSRIKHKTSDAKKQGIMLVNPGGPGGSGLTLSRLGGAVPNKGGDPYDWIGFDPRGVGSSVPTLACDGNYFGYNRPDYRVTKAGTSQAWLKKSAAYSASCSKAAGAKLMPHMKTIDNVRDMDSIRKALGEKQINFYGFSYGTYLGQVYATMFPKQTRRMVMDGVVDPRDVWYDANLNQDIAFDKNMDVFFDWVAGNDATYHLGTSGKAIKKQWYSMRDKLAKKPANGKIGPDEWTDAYLNAGYYVFGWEDDGAALAAALQKGDFGPTTALYDDANGSGPGSDNSYAVYLGTQCTDVKWSNVWSKWLSDNSKVDKKAPFETWANAMFNLPCTSWPVKATNAQAMKIDGSKVGPVLLIAETHDGATPFPGALEVRKRFPKSALIEGVGGTTHSGSLNGIACTDDKISAYLLTGAMPARTGGPGHADVECDPVPQPEPGPANEVTDSASSTKKKHHHVQQREGMQADLRSSLQKVATVGAR